MNTDLFNKSKVELAAHIEQWFKEHPGILDPLEKVVIGINVEKRAPLVEVVCSDFQIGADSQIDKHIFDESVYKLESLIESEGRARCFQIMDNAGIKTIGQLVQKSESQILKLRNCGSKSLWHIKTALKKLDPRLYLGMRH